MPPSEEFSPRVSLSAPLVSLTGVSEARLKSKLFALRFPPNLTHSGSSRPSWLFERRINRSWCRMSPGSSSAFRLPRLPQTPVRSFRGSLGGSGPNILRWLVPVPLLHLVSTSETPKVIRLCPSACASLQGLPSSSFSGPLLRSPLSGLRSRSTLLSQCFARFRAVFHLCATQRVSFIPKNEAGFRTRCTPCFPSCVKVLFQTGNAPGVPRSPHPFAPSAPKSFLCAVLLPSLHPKVLFQLACVAMTLVLFNFSKSSKRTSRLHHLGLLIRPHLETRNTLATQIRAKPFVCWAQSLFQMSVPTQTPQVFHRLVPMRHLSKNCANTL